MLKVQSLKSDAQIYISISGLEVGIKFSLINCLDDLKMDGMDVMDGRGTFQGTTASLWDWDGRKLVFTKGQCKVLPPGHNNPMHPHSFGAEQLQGISVGRDRERIIESFILEKTSKIL